MVPMSQEQPLPNVEREESEWYIFLQYGWEYSKVERSKDSNKYQQQEPPSEELFLSLEGLIFILEVCRCFSFSFSLSLIMEATFSKIFFTL